MSDPTGIIHSDPDILGGTPVFAGTRVPLQNLIDYFAGGDSLDEFLRQFPSVRREQAEAALTFARGAYDGSPAATPVASRTPTEEPMELGAFSVSLAVKDLEASRQFYEKLGFTRFAGDPAQHWLILKNGDRVIGLFQGMFERNILTFNPGWDQDAQPLAAFTDVRELQRRLRADGVAFATEADESTSGPASFVVVDPDGNPILFDQHV